MKIYAVLILCGLVLAGLTAAGAGAWRMAYNAGATAAKLECKAVQDAIADAVRKQAEQSAADLEAVRAQGDQALGRVLRAVRSQRVYTDCSHSPDALRAINEALTGRREEQ